MSAPEKEEEEADGGETKEEPKEEKAEAGTAEEEKMNPLSFTTRGDCPRSA